MRTLRFFLALVATNLKASLALRGAFWVRAGFMFANNFIFMVMWWVFFDRFDEVRGWRMADMAALYAVAASVFGLSVILAAGVRELAGRIADGELDAFLTQPQSTLVQCVATRSEASGWGDLASGVVFFLLCGYVSPASVPVCLVVVLCGTVVYLATGVLFHASAFWLGDSRTLARQAHDSMLIVALYPSAVFGGTLRLMLFTVLPAGFMTYLPVDLLRRFSWPALGALAAASAAYGLLAVLVFHLGLRRYESGNRVG